MRARTSSPRRRFSLSVVRGAVAKRVGRAGVAALAALVLLMPAGSASAQEAVQFTILDNLSPGQTEEVITVYIGARNVGTLHVHAGRQADRLVVSVPRAASYDYTLCGKLRVREGGRVSEHEINDGGTLTDVEGRTFAAYTEGAAAFYLLDVTEGRPVTEVRRDPTRRCAAAVASR